MACRFNGANTSPRRKFLKLHFLRSGKTDATQCNIFPPPPNRFRSSRNRFVGRGRGRGPRLESQRHEFRQSTCRTSRPDSHNFEKSHSSFFTFSSGRASALRPRAQRHSNPNQMIAPEPSRLPAFPTSRSPPVSLLSSAQSTMETLHGQQGSGRLPARTGSPAMEARSIDGEAALTGRFAWLRMPAQKVADQFDGLLTRRGAEYKFDQLVVRGFHRPAVEFQKDQRGFPARSACCHRETGGSGRGGTGTPPPSGRGPDEGTGPQRSPQAVPARTRAVLDRAIPEFRHASRSARRAFRGLRPGSESGEHPSTRQVS